MIQNAVERRLDADPHHVTDRRFRIEGTKAARSLGRLAIKCPGQFGTAVVEPGTSTAKPVHALLQQIVITFVQFDLDLPESLAIVRTTVDHHQIVVQLGQHALVAILQDQSPASRLQRGDHLQSGPPGDSKQDVNDPAGNDVSRTGPFVLDPFENRSMGGPGELERPDPAGNSLADSVTERDVLSPQAEVRSVEVGGQEPLLGQPHGVTDEVPQVGHNELRVCRQLGFPLETSPGHGRERTQLSPSSIRTYRAPFVPFDLSSGLLGLLGHLVTGSSTGHQLVYDDVSGLLGRMGVPTGELIVGARRRCGTVPDHSPVLTPMTEFQSH